MSFADTGLLEELKKSRKYVPMYKQMEELQQMAEELGRKKGIKDGMEKGIDETKKTIAKRMKEMGHGDETIVEITGLPLAVVRKL